MFSLRMDGWMDESADRSKAITSYFLCSQWESNKVSLTPFLPRACPATTRASREGHFIHSIKTTAIPLGHLATLEESRDLSFE